MATIGANPGAMVTMLLALLIAQSVVSPVPPPAAASAPPGWTSVTFATPIEYGHFVRHEADGTDSVLVASRHVCDCRPVALLNTLQRAFATISKGTAVQARSTTAVCGQPADHLIVTNLATPANVLRNTEMFAFRDGDALVVLDYTFRSTAPMPNAEATLATLCPAGPAGAAESRPPVP